MILVLDSASICDVILRNLSDVVNGMSLILDAGEFKEQVYKWMTSIQDDCFILKTLWELWIKSIH